MEVEGLFVVDGYNAIRRVDQLRSAEQRGGLGAGRRALLSAILSSGVLRAHRVLVVFDASAEGPGSEPSPHPRLAVRFSRPPEDADETILSLVAGAKRRDVEEGLAVTVVTADRELQSSVRRLGAGAISPDAWEGLKVPRRLRARPLAAGGAADKPEVTAADVGYWLEIFGGDSGDER